MEKYDSTIYFCRRKDIGYKRVVKELQSARQEAYLQRTNWAEMLKKRSFKWGNHTQLHDTENVTMFSCMIVENVYQRFERVLSVRIYNLLSQRGDDMISWLKMEVV